MMKIRFEEDSLGRMSVPAEAMYGAQTARALANFPISGLCASPALIRAYLQIKLAAARVNKTCQALPEGIPEQIIRTVQQILSSEQSWRELFPVDVYQAGAGTSQNMNINEVIANLANQLRAKEPGPVPLVAVHPNDHVNRSQSTNDTYPTAMRLALLESSKPLIEELRKLAKAFREKGQAWDNIPKSARTHLQDAVPIRLGQEMTAYGITVERCARWVEIGRDALRELGIGGSAAGTGLTVPDGFAPGMIQELESLTGEKLSLSGDLCEAMQSQSPVLLYSSMLRIMAAELTRICNDLRLLSSGPNTGFAEIILPAVQPGSSIMPGKVNPSILEMANQTWFSVMGFDHTVALAVQAGQLELNVMMPIMAHSLLEATRIAAHTARVVRQKAIDGMKPNESRLRRYFESTPQIATALSPKLGYEATAKLVTEAIETGRSVVELVRERKLIKEDELESLLDVRRLTGI